MLYELLAYALVALPFGIAFLLAVGLICLVVGMYRYPIVAIVAVLLMAFWDGAAYHLGSIRLGIVIYPQDVLFACIGLVVLLRLALVAAEALACGVPAIFADVPGLRDFRAPFPETVYCDPTPESILEALRAAASIPSPRRERIAIDQAATAQRLYGIERGVRAYLQLYRGA